MKTAPLIYVFVCGKTHYRALSFRKDGSTLPPCLVAPHTWTYAGEIPYEPGAIIALDMEPAAAMASLEARGYHVARVTPIFAKPEPVKQRF